MSDPANVPPNPPADGPACARCARSLSAEKPVRLPDGAQYCAACCERMATEAFEMETGMHFVPWIEKRDELVMQHQPLELTVRRTLFAVPLLVVIIGLGTVGYGIYRGASGEAPWRGATSAYIGIGCGMVAFFGLLVLKQGQQYLRAAGFSLRLKDGVFTLRHGTKTETFPVAAVTQACVVRPGMVGAREGALGFADGRMLTLDSCLTDLHALGVVMDLRTGKEFPPSLEDQERERRDKLRKIRGLS